MRLCFRTGASKSPTDALDHLSRNIRRSCGLGWRGGTGQGGRPGGRGATAQSLDCESTSKKRSAGRRKPNTAVAPDVFSFLSSSNKTTSQCVWPRAGFNVFADAVTFPIVVC